jgi:hypothetical protein
LPRLSSLPPQRSILKTSSGKIRRLATCALLTSGGLSESILRRSSQKGAKPGVSAAVPQWNVRPSVAAPGPSREAHPAKGGPAASKKGAPASSSSSSSSALPDPSGESDFELVSNGSKSPSSSPPAEVSPSEPLDRDDVMKRVAAILGEELSLDAETVLLLASSFSFDESCTLDEFGLDSLSKETQHATGEGGRHSDAPPQRCSLRHCRREIAGTLLQ